MKPKMNSSLLCIGDYLPERFKQSPVLQSVKGLPGSVAANGEAIVVNKLEEAQAHLLLSAWEMEVVG